MNNLQTKAMNTITEMASDYGIMAEIENGILIVVIGNKTLMVASDGSIKLEWNVYSLTTKGTYKARTESKVYHFNNLKEAVQKCLI